MTEVIKHNDINFSKLIYSKPEKQNNIYFSSISYDNKPLYIQTNKINFSYIKDDKNTTRKYINVSMPTTDFSLYDKLLKLDDHILNTTFTNSKAWFNKDITLDIFENQYNRITQPFEKGTTPFLDMRIPIIRNKIQCNLYDQSNNMIDIDKLNENDSIICILHIKGIKFLKEIFYVDFYINQIKLCKSMQYLIPTNCLIEDDISENYDYEILDEEYIIQYTKKKELEGRYNELSEKIKKDNLELSKLKHNIESLE